ncbi:MULTISPECIES: helix-turn-helix domain-containing protein [Bacillaceae]|uniref:Helix-turn-helix transcriptional regulator n=1 Tax=Evansella alkalicola TaxID=745819 RepID=A0ABS6JNN3_9BACI|nr:MULTISPECIES: helix-turn-helix transcriptional regulator [Bacillaceae]MBU9720093.1 helix-turn-helix transcriptional regulator [Bacillus alkalicola]
MHIGNRLRKIRSLKNIPQSKVCRGIVSASHYSNIESGRYEPSEDILELIAKRLQIPSNYLIQVHDESTKISEKLAEYHHLIDSDLEKADEYLEKWQEQLSYIPSIHQEVKYLLLQCLHQLKKVNVTRAQDLHKEVSHYIGKDNLSSLSRYIKYKYYYVSGLLKFYERDFIESFELYSEALNFTSTEMDKARIQFNLSLICYYINDKHKALLYAQDAKNVYMDLHKWKETVEVYNIQGILYTDLQNFEKAVEVLNKGLNLATERKLSLQTSQVLHNLGMLYFRKEEYDLSLEYLTKSSKMKLVHDPSNVFVTYAAILRVYLKTQNFRELKITLKDALKVSNNKMEAYQLMEIEAQMEYLLLNYDKYEKLMEDCISYYYSNNFWIELEGNAKHFSNYHLENRRYKKAHYYLDIELQAINKIYKERS